jgi:hypothetical protein
MLATVGSRLKFPVEWVEPLPPVRAPVHITHAEDERTEPASCAVISDPRLGGLGGGNCTASWNDLVPCANTGSVSVCR